MRVFLAGDILNQFNENQFIDESLQQVIRSADYSICNFEGVVEHGSLRKRMIQKRSTIKSLKDAGFQLCLLANNHITDYGKLGLQSTINDLKESGMAWTGAGLSFDQAYLPKVVTIDNETLCIINICEAHFGFYESKEQSFGYAWMGNDIIDDLISNSALIYDYLIVCVHAGLEHETMPLPLFRRLFRHYCDLGADCVIASHPHIAQGIERYKYSIIAYSLGNFYFPRDKGSNNKDPENCSFSMMICLSNEDIQFDIIYHKVTNLVVQKCTRNEIEFDIDILSNQLSDSEYNDYFINNIERLYNSYINNHFKYIFRGTSPQDSLSKKISFTIQYLFNLPNYRNDEIGRNKFILRMFQNETFRSLIITTMKHRVNDEFSF